MCIGIIIDILCWSSVESGVSLIYKLSKGQGYTRISARLTLTYLINFVHDQIIYSHQSSYAEDSHVQPKRASNNTLLTLFTQETLQFLFTKFQNLNSRLCILVQHIKWHSSCFPVYNFLSISHQHALLCPVHCHFSLFVIRSTMCVTLVLLISHSLRDLLCSFPAWLASCV